MEEKAEVQMDEMECVCGEILKSEVPGEVAAQYAEHMNREDHKASPAQWTEAQKRIEAGRERMKKQQQPT